MHNITSVWKHVQSVIDVNPRMGCLHGVISAVTEDFTQNILYMLFVNNNDAV